MYQVHLAVRRKDAEGRPIVTCNSMAGVIGQLSQVSTFRRRGKRTGVDRSFWSIARVTRRGIVLDEEAGLPSGWRKLQQVQYVSFDRCGQAIQR